VQMLAYHKAETVAAQLQEPSLVPQVVTRFSAGWRDSR